jgi:hypothetical protein
MKRNHNIALAKMEACESKSLKLIGEMLFDKVSVIKVKTSKKKVTINKSEESIHENDLLSFDFVEDLNEDQIKLREDIWDESINLNATGLNIIENWGVKPNSGVDETDEKDLDQLDALERLKDDLNNSLHSEFGFQETTEMTELEKLIREQNLSSSFEGEFDLMHSILNYYIIHGKSATI